MSSSRRLQRIKRRRQERGAVLFIVAMTLAVLASLGLYALAASTNEMRQAGYERVNTQSHYMSEFAAVAAANSIDYQTAQTYVNMANDVSKRDKNCISLPAINSANSTLLSAGETRTACYRIGKTEMATQWGTMTALPATNPFGPYTNTGDFYAELTDTACAPMPDPAQLSASPGQAA